MTEEEIEQIKEDADSSSELLIIDNVLDLKNLKALDIMSPRADITGIDKNDPPKKVLETLKKYSHAVYPVYNGSLDDILGIVKANDLFVSLIGSKRFRVTDVMQKCLFVSPAMPVLDLLLQMRKDQIEMALVVDEFGGVDGLVSITDVIEEIVGEIRGVSKEVIESTMKKHKNGMITLDARMPLEDFENEVGVSLTDEEDIDTVGGAIFNEIGRIPVKGELITIGNGVVCEIIEANPRTIKTIKIREIKKEDSKKK